MSSGPRITIDTTAAETIGIDGALIDALHDDLADSYDAGLINREDLQISQRLIYEALHGGPLMAYYDHAKNEAVKAIAGLADIDPTNAAEVIKVQLAIRAVHRLIEWASGYISMAPRRPASDSQEVAED